MNRYLDHDLSDDEQKQLFRHLDDCAECAERFEMLKLLSDKLSSLPDVKPRYSLVDAILPQLDEIDKAKTSEQKEIPVKSNVTPLMRSVDDDKKQGRTSAQRRRGMWTRVAGGAAAAVILGFFIYQFQPKEIPDAEPALQKNVTQNAGTGASAGSSNNTGTSGDSASSTKEGRDASSSANPGSEPEIQKQQTLIGSDQTPDQAAPQGTHDAAGSDDSSAKPFSSMAKDEPADRHSASDKQQNMGKEPAKDSKSVSAIDPGPNASAPADSSANDKISVPGNAGIAGTLTAPDSSGMNQQQEPQISPNVDSSLLWGIMTKLAPADQWSSEDGTYTAILEDGHLNVYDISSGDRVKIYDDPILGSWVQGAWDPQSDIFSYTVIQDGQTLDSKVDAKAAAASIEK